jgi:hypothetical protein
MFTKPQGVYESVSVAAIEVSEVLINRIML